MESSKNVVETDAEKSDGQLGNKQRSFGRYVAHKQQDTMGEILKSHFGFENFKYNHESDFVDNPFKEVKHIENGNVVQAETDQRHRAYKHHDTMGEIIHNCGDVHFGKLKNNHDSDFVDKRINKINSKDIDLCPVERKFRNASHKYHDTMGEIIQNGDDFEKFKYNRDSDFIDNRFKETKPNSENEGEKLTNNDGYYIKKDIKFHHNPIW